MKPRRRLKNLKISLLSLCAKPANLQPIVLKTDGSVVLSSVVKFDKEKDEILGLVAVPDIPDAEGDVILREDIQAAAHDFMVQKGGVDMEHNMRRMDEEASVVESFIVQKGDPRFLGWTDNADRPVDAEGSWGVVIKLLSDDLIEQARSGKIGGLSMFGRGERVPIAKSDDNPDPQDPPPPDEDPMPISDTDLKNIGDTVAKSIGETLSTALTEALKPVTEAVSKTQPPPKDEVKEPEPEPKELDFTKASDEEIRKHVLDLELAELKEASDLSTADGIRKFQDARAELIAKNQPEEEEPEEEEYDSPFHSPAPSRSRTPVQKSQNREPVAFGCGPWALERPEDIEAYNAGVEIAKSLNPETSTN